jgi:hypothetical protein
MKTRQRRPGKEVIAARVREVANVLLDGAVPALDVVDFIREREADQGSPFHVGEGREPLSYSQCRKIIKRAEKLIGETVKDDRKKLLDLHLAKRRNLYAKAVAIADYRCALSILQDEAQLCGLYPAKRTEHTGVNGQALPSLSAMVFAIIQAESKNDEQRIDSGDAPDEHRRIAGPLDRGQEVPEVAGPLRNPLLQDTGVE